MSVTTPEQTIQHARRSYWGTQDKVAEVRTWLRDLLKIDHPCLERAFQCATEIVTNALVHTNSGSRDPLLGWFRVEFEWTADWVKVSVHDTGSSSEPHVVDAASDDEGGRGLRIVEHESNHWGNGPSPTGIGRVVWFIVRAE